MCNQFETIYKNINQIYRIQINYADTDMSVKGSYQPNKQISWTLNMHHKCAYTCLLHYQLPYVHIMLTVLYSESLRLHSRQNQTVSCMFNPMHHKFDVIFHLKGHRDQPAPVSCQSAKDAESCSSKKLPHTHAHARTHTLSLSFTCTNLNTNHF